MEKKDKELADLKTSAPNGGVPPKNKTASCCASVKVFLVALCFSYYAKAFSGSYMKSSITQIERRFDISSSTVGMVDGSFEFGNLLVIAFVSYFGSNFHRPRIIAVGCFVMAMGCFLTAMPHFFMGAYKYEAVRTHMTPPNNSTGSSYSVSPCLANITLTEDIKTGCVKETSSYTWVYVMIGNMLRGIGETPITPLGIAYLDDFAAKENTALYLAFLHTVAMFGPMSGFMLSSVFAKLYVDIGFVDLDTVTITPQDARWVGAWWLGFLVAGVFSLIAGIPFCFLPRRIETPEGGPAPEGQRLRVPETLQAEPHKRATIKGFFLSLKALACNNLYVLLMCYTLLQTNSFLGFITYKPKYMEQQYGQTTSKSNFITGVSTLPAVALGVLLGGVVMKKFKFGLLSASKMLLVSSVVAFVMSLSVFVLGCENRDIAGMTVSYNGSKLDTFRDHSLFSSCNTDCSCSPQQWDPVCGENNITYLSACLAGCKSSTGSGRSLAYHNCSCVASMAHPLVNSSVTLGSCPPSDDCARMFFIYVISQIFTSFMFALGGSAGTIIVLWSVPPELKSLAVGIQMLLIRVLAGIPAPIYFGALIDRTCLKWGTKSCGGRGACRVYDTHSFRNTFLGLTAGIRAPSFILLLCFIFIAKKKFSVNKEKEQEDGGKKAATEGGNGAIDAPEIEKQTFI